MWWGSEPALVLGDPDGCLLAGCSVLSPVLELSLFQGSAHTGSSLGFWHYGDKGWAETFVSLSTQAQLTTSAPCLSRGIGVL